MVRLHFAVIYCGASVSAVCLLQQTHCWHTVEVNLAVWDGQSDNLMETYYIMFHYICLCLLFNIYDMNMDREESELPVAGRRNKRRKRVQKQDELNWEEVRGAQWEGGIRR